MLQNLCRCVCVVRARHRIVCCSTTPSSFMSLYILLLSSAQAFAGEGISKQKVLWRLEMVLSIC